MCKKSVTICTCGMELFPVCNSHCLFEDLYTTFPTIKDYGVLTYICTASYECITLILRADITDR